MSTHSAQIYAPSVRIPTNVPVSSPPPATCGKENFATGQHHGTISKFMYLLKATLFSNALILGGQPDTALQRMLAADAMGLNGGGGGG